MGRGRSVDGLDLDWVAMTQVTKPRLAVTGVMATQSRNRDRGGLGEMGSPRRGSATQDSRRTIGEAPMR